MTLFRAAGAFALALGATGMIVAAAYAQHDHDVPAPDAHASTHAEHAANSDMKARCPIDGMKMKASGMVKVEHDGADLYFCGQQQADMFLKDPARYYKTSKLGDLVVHMSVLTKDEHVQMMKSMGMGRMVDAAKLEAKTHHVTVWVTEGDREPALDGAGLALQIVGTDGAMSTTTLKRNRMMKTYDAAITAQGDGEQKVAVVITTPPVSL
ncbi:hypothetical protein CMK11_16835 [Candidatus Poribacteria bacterium]|nr:hypothetical protein [Candidatus Poribacteria bacterium]